jgi:4'-phosphopantetheinyl transferase
MSLEFRCQGRSTLPREEIAVWYCRTHSLTAREYRSIMSILSIEERRRVYQLVSYGHRRDFATAHWLLRTALSVYLARNPAEWRFQASAHGKPTIAMNSRVTDSLCFNLSHTDGLVACAIGHDDVGIDVEQCDGAIEVDEIARVHFDRRECMGLQESSGAEHAARFVELWTLKESYLKAVGLGLSAPLDSCCFVFEGASSLRLEANDRRDWQFWIGEVMSGSRLAVAALRSSNACPLRITFNDASQDGASVRPRLVRSTSEIRSRMWSQHPQR